MNANGFKKFEHDSPYGRFGFRQNLPVCIQPVSYTHLTLPTIYSV